MPPVSPNTAQFLYRALILTACLGVLAILGIDAGCIFVFGDGTATRLIGELNGPLVTVFSWLGAATLGHQVVASVLGRLLGTSVSVAPSGASSNETNTTTPVTIHTDATTPMTIRTGTAETPTTITTTGANGV